MGKPVDLPREVTRMKGRLLTADRGDGSLFKVRENRLQAFLARNPKGFVVGSAASTPVAVELTQAPPEVEHRNPLEEMTVVELRAMAAERGVELPSGANKRAIVEALSA